MEIMTEATFKELKKGDKVYLRTDLEIDEDYGTNDTVCDMVELADKLQGTTPAIVREVKSFGCQDEWELVLEEDPSYYWTREMLLEKPLQVEEK